MEYRFEVENIKCGGCAGSISTKLEGITGVATVSVDIEAGVVLVVTQDGENSDSEEDTRALITESLLKMGYPEKGSVEGLKAVKAKASSFVSCAVGKLNEKP